MSVNAGNASCAERAHTRRAAVQRRYLFTAFAGVCAAFTVVAVYERKTASSSCRKNGHELPAASKPAHLVRAQRAQQRSNLLCPFQQARLALSPLRAGTCALKPRNCDARLCSSAQACSQFGVRINRKQKAMSARRQGSVESKGILRENV